MGVSIHQASLNNGWVYSGLYGKIPSFDSWMITGASPMTKRKFHQFIGFNSRKTWIYLMIFHHQRCAVHQKFDWKNTGWQKAKERKIGILQHNWKLTRHREPTNRTGWLYRQELGIFFQISYLVSTRKMIIWWTTLGFWGTQLFGHHYLLIRWVVGPPWVNNRCWGGNPAVACGCWFTPGHSWRSFEQGPLRSGGR